MTAMTAMIDARLYLAPSEKSLWRWDEEFSAIHWIDGPTITLRQELAIVLAAQPNSGRGLPNLASILVLLSACRESWSESRPFVIRMFSENDALTWSSSASVFYDLLSRLDSIHGMAREFHLASRKAELVAQLFATLENPDTNLETASSIVGLLAPLGKVDQLIVVKPGEIDVRQILGQLDRALQRFDPASYRLWVATGLEQEVQPAPLEVELTSGQRVRALLTELNDDDELGGVARLAKQLLAAIALPRPLAEPDDLPLGGVSDIANRGALDRLLLSELAYDDLTLAVRVATGEALYYRRETPPKSPPLRRLIVLDSGLRQWGVPRIFITSIGLALAAGGDDKLAIETYRGCGEQLVPIDLTRQTGLHEHLAALETDLHLGFALHAVAELQTGTSTGEKVPSDVVLVTSDDALADEEFRQQLRAAQLEGAWIASINRAGRVRLLELGLREMILKREARFELDSILKPSRKPVAPLLSGDGKLPAFCRLKQCPLRLPHDLSVDRAWAIGNQGILAIYKDCRLTWWDDVQRGPQLLAENMPRGRVLWADSASQHMPFRAVVGTLSNRGMHALQVWPGEREVCLVQLKHEHTEQFTSVTATAEHIFAIGPHGVVAFAWTGEELATCKVTDRHLGGRYFLRSGTRFIGAVTVRGGRIGLTAGYTLTGRPEEVLTIAGEREQPKVICRDGTAIDLISGEGLQHVLRKLPDQRPLQLLAQSRDGRRLVLLCHENQQTSQLLLRLDECDCQQVWGDPSLAVEPQITKFLGLRITLRQHFQGLHATAAGNLALVSRKGQELTIVPHPRVFLKDTGRSQARRPQLRMFENVDAPFGYSLQRATWDDGSQAWLDSRGLLHLKSSNPQVAELTVVLQDGETAGWSAADGPFGPTYFTGLPAAATTPRPIFATLHAFIASLVNVATT